MRILSLLLIAGTFCSSGCSFMVSGSGLKLRNLSTREQIQAEFGSPHRTASVDGQFVEHYKTRRKLEDSNGATGEIWLAAFSLGASEAICLPYELYLLGIRTALGQELRVHSNEDGSIDHIFVEPIGFLAPGLGEIEPYRQDPTDD